MVEENQLSYLRHLVIVLTTSGKDKLDDEAIKKLKKICKQSDCYVIELYKMLNKQLRKRHAEIRFSAFQICDEIFRRSHCFRELLLKDFKQFSGLVLGYDKKNPLPKPRAIAEKLKQKSVETFQQWYDTYSKGYLTLKLGYKYLKDCKKVDFAELTARTEAQRQRDEEQRLKAENIKKRRIEKIKGEIEASSEEIQSAILQLQNSFRLLIPDVQDFFIPLENADYDIDEANSTVEMEEETQSGDDEYGTDNVRNHGIMIGMNVTINLDDVKKVKETPDNEVIVQNLKEHYSVIKTKLLPQVKKWEEIMRPYSEGNGLLIKHILDLKNNVERSIKMFESINIQPMQEMITSSQGKVLEEFDSSDDDDDFIEVTSDDPRVQRAMASEADLLGVKGPSWAEISNDIYHDPMNQPSTSKSSAIEDTASPSSCKGTGNSPMSKCPDEYLDKIIHKPLRHHNPLAGLSQVWMAAPDIHDNDDEEDTGGILGIATQRIDYKRSWEPVKWTCRAPLATGRLCPRKDREKCPLHGPIIPRDNLGQPVTAEDAARLKAEQEQYERDNPEWQDPQLLAEIKAATGVDLKIPKGKHKRKRKYENLTDLKKTTPYDRLAKKVLSRKAVSRVNEMYRKESSSKMWGSSNFNPS